MVRKKVNHEQKIRDSWNDIQALRKIKETLRKYKNKHPTIFESEKKEAWMLVTSRLDELGTNLVIDSSHTAKKEEEVPAEHIKPDVLADTEEIKSLLLKELEKRIEIIISQQIEERFSIKDKELEIKLENEKKNNEDIWGQQIEELKKSMENKANLILSQVTKMEKKNTRKK